MEPNPHEFLERGYFDSIKGFWQRGIEKKGARAIPRLLIGSFLFTIGYILMWSHKSIEELKEWLEMRREQQSAVGKEVKIKEFLD